MSIIKVENLSKSYLINHEGQERYTALRDVVANKAKKIFSLPSTNQQINKSTKEEFWALKDVSFDINPGDRVGIIGRNGAGKSTLLKILSRITEPTKGKITIKGRVASLLEVGTGFHPELTGRENIFLNGAILGMTRTEIRSKFDEIVAFAEIEKFLDTPVKRYSSGMYVRLAFAVAAHLEPEVLIVDEVLAVGDAQFQKKCLGKMEDVSKNEGRTVLFVSHNISVISSLCNKGILLGNGKLDFEGNIHEAIQGYLDFFNNGNTTQYKGNHVIHSATLNKLEGVYNLFETIGLSIEFSSQFQIFSLVLGLVIKDSRDVSILGINNLHYSNERLNKGPVNSGNINVTIPNINFAPGTYKISLFLGDSTKDVEVVEDCLVFTIDDQVLGASCKIPDKNLNKIVLQNINWSYTEK